MIDDVFERVGCIIEPAVFVGLTGNGCIKLLYASVNGSSSAVADRHISNRHRLRVINMRIEITITFIALCPCIH